MDWSLPAGATAARRRTQTESDILWNKGGLVVREAVLDDLDAITKLECDSFPKIRSRAVRSAIFCARRIGR